MPEPPSRPPRHFLYEQATRLESLERAWLRVLRNAGAAGADGLTVAEFARAAPVRLISLHRSLRDGSYRPGPLRRVAIPKPAGGERVLLIPGIADRIVQTAVAEALVPVLEPGFEDDSFAYRPGRSVAQAVERVRRLRADGYQWVIDGDIERYFDRVPHDPLLGLLETHLDDPALLDLIAQWLEQASAETGGSFGLPQGSPLSPLLSNLYLDQLDDAAQDAALGAGVRLEHCAKSGNRFSQQQCDRTKGWISVPASGDAR